MKTLTSKIAYREARSLGMKNTRQLLERPTRYEKKFLPIKLMKELEGSVLLLSIVLRLLPDELFSRTQLILYSLLSINSLLIALRTEETWNNYRNTFV